MADDASRLRHLSDDALLTHFNSTYHQATSWQLWTLSSAPNSALTGALYKTRPPAASLAIELRMVPLRGRTDRPSGCASLRLDPHSLGLGTPSLFSCI